MILAVKIDEFGTALCHMDSGSLGQGYRSNPLNFPGSMMWREGHWSSPAGRTLTACRARTWKRRICWREWWKSFLFIWVVPLQVTINALVSGLGFFCTKIPTKWKELLQFLLENWLKPREKFCVHFIDNFGNFHLGLELKDLLTPRMKISY